MSSLFARLKAGTERQHLEIEAVVDPMHSFASLEAYKVHLLNTWLFHASLEAELSRLDWSGLGIDYVSRLKTPLLEEDLRLLGVPRPSPEEGQPPGCEPIRALPWAACMSSKAPPWAAGSSVVTWRPLESARPLAGCSSNGYGARTGEMWQSFQLRAAEYCVTDDQIDAAVAGRQVKTMKTSCGC